MTDIVQRLREHDGNLGVLVEEAAAEIERLRADYSILKSDYDAQRGDIETLQAELRYERSARAALEPKP